MFKLISFIYIYKYYLGIDGQQLEGKTILQFKHLNVLLFTPWIKKETSLPSEILTILLLFMRSVLTLERNGNPSSLRISLSLKSIVSNWSRVEPRFSMTGILYPRRSSSRSRIGLIYCPAHSIRSGVHLTIMEI